MADILNQGEFWLPPEFLTDDDILMDKENAKQNTLNTAFGPNFGFTAGVPYDLGSFGSSSVSSPVESVLGSPETQSDEEDFLVGVTSTLDRSTLQGKIRRIPSASLNLEKPLRLSVSPQSTLTGVGSWSRRSAAFSNGSPHGPSQAPSPPTTPLGGNVSWDLIYAAAGQVARLKMRGEGPPGSRGTLGHHQILRTVHPLPPAAKSPHLGLYGDHCLSQNLSFADNYTRQHDQVLKQQHSSIWGRPSREGYFSQQQVMGQNRGAGGRVPVYGALGAENGGRCGHTLGMPKSAWVPPQHRPNLQPQRGGSGMRAVFLGGSGVKRECAGTGVFLPRRYGNPPEPRKKSGNCSTALLPARVVQVLNKNFDGMKDQPHFNGSSAPDYDVLMARRNALLMQQRRHLRPEVPPLSHELCLPHEWTY